MAWPSVRRAFDLPVSGLGVLLAAAMSGYLASSFGSGALVTRFGVGHVLLWSSALTMASTAGYALAPAWPAVIGAGVVTGLESCGIDAGINAYAAVNFSPRVMSWLHASYGVGAALGPLVMTAALARGLGWRWGYALIALALAAVTLCFAFTVRLWRTARHPADAHARLNGQRADDLGATALELSSAAVRPAQASAPPGAAVIGPDAGALATLGRPVVLAGAAVFFVYTGLEATAGQWTYSLFTESRGMSPAMAGTWTSAFWASLTTGRLLAGALAPRVAARALLRVSMAGAPLGALGIWLFPGPVASLCALIVVGVALAPVYPLLTSETPRRLGGDGITHAVGFQVAAAYLGTAALPGAAGWMASWIGLEVIGPFLVIAALGLLALYEWTLRLARTEARHALEAHGEEHAPAQIRILPPRPGSRVRNSDRIDTMLNDADDRRRAARARWPVRRFRLGEEPPDDLSEVTTATERIAMMWALAEEAWRISGRPWPAYDRRSIPARLFRPGDAPPDDDA